MKTHELVKPGDLEAVYRVLNDFRTAFGKPSAEDGAFDARIYKIVHETVWDVAAQLQARYEQEADESMREMAAAEQGEVEFDGE